MICLSSAGNLAWFEICNRCTLRVIAVLMSSVSSGEDLHGKKFSTVPNQCLEHFKKKVHRPRLVQTSVESRCWVLSTWKWENLRYPATHHAWPWEFSDSQQGPRRGFLENHAFKTRSAILQTLTAQSLFLLPTLAEVWPPTRNKGVFKTLKQACFSEYQEAQDAFKDSMIHVFLQFTLRIAIRCVLHRCESQEIRCQKLFLFL